MNEATATRWAGPTVPPKWPFKTQINTCVTAPMTRLSQTDSYSCDAAAAERPPGSPCDPDLLARYHFFPPALLLMTSHVPRMRPPPPPRGPGSRRETKISSGRNSHRRVFCPNVAPRQELKGKHLTRHLGGNPGNIIKHPRRSPSGRRRGDQNAKRGHATWHGGVICRVSARCEADGAEGRSFAALMRDLLPASLSNGSHLLGC